MTKPVNGWWTDIACYIGQMQTGAFYCANECDWYEGKCQEAVTARDQLGYYRFRVQQLAETRKEQARAEQRKQDRMATIRSYDTRRGDG